MVVQLFLAMVGGICSTDSEIELHHCSISENRATDQGGGVYLENGNIFMDYVSFYMNIAVSYGGGSFYCFQLSCNYP